LQQYKDTIQQQNEYINQIKFDLELSHNENDAKSFQLSKMESKCQSYLDALDKLQVEREKDREQFGKDLNSIKRENEEYRKTIYSLKMREIETSRVVGNAESKIRQQHEARENLVKKLREFECENRDISVQLLSRNRKYKTLKGR